MEHYYLALDLGGTKTSGSVFTKDGSLLDDFVYVSSSPAGEGTQAFYANACGVISHLMDHFMLRQEQILGIGIGAPGPLDAKTQTILGSPLLGLKNFAIGSLLKKDFGVATALDNDGNLGALAEQRCGKAKGLDAAVYMTVSTGIGGGIVLGGQIYRGHHGGAGEIGHVCLDPLGEPCPCGAHGCAELLASGTALNRQMRRDREKGIKSLVFQWAEYDPGKLSGSLLSEAARAGDSYAREVFHQEGVLLGRLTATIFNLLDPDMLVIGGGVSKSHEFFHPTLMETARQWSIGPIDETQVQYSDLNDRVILYGAYHLIRETLHSD